MNQVTSGTGSYSPVTYTQLPLKDTTGGVWGMKEDGSFPAGCLHFHNAIAVGNSDQSWSYDDYNLKSLKDWAVSYNRRLDTTETDNSIKVEFQGTVQASSAYDIKEVGLFGNIMPYNTGNAVFLVSRDVLPSPISVAQNDVVIVYYRITVGGT
jgi:hypothetical protein